MPKSSTRMSIDLGQLHTLAGALDQETQHLVKVNAGTTLATQVYADLHTEADRQGRTPAALMRDAIHAYLQIARQSRISGTQ
jgi:hypothetical protein